MEPRTPIIVWGFGPGAWGLSSADFPRLVRLEQADIRRLHQQGGAKVYTYYPLRSMTAYRLLQAALGEGRE